MKKEITLIIALLTMLVGIAAEAKANPRTFVSSTGTDNNVCGFTSPCRTFDWAASRTDQNGILTALDSGSYGKITITNAMTVQAAPGVHATLGDGPHDGQVHIDAKAGEVIVLRNLQLNRLFNPTGIEFISGGTLHIEDCVVAGFSTGIDFNPKGGCIGEQDSCPKLFVKDSFIRRNKVGVALRSVAASLDNCRIENNETGLQVGSVAKVTISDSVVAGNSGYGITTDYFSVTNVEGCKVTNNGTGLEVFSDSVAPGRMYVSDTVIAGNNLGVRAAVNNTGEIAGNIFSYRNNRLANNGTNGAFTNTISQQ